MVEDEEEADSRLGIWEGSDGVEEGGEVVWMGLVVGIVELEEVLVVTCHLLELVPV